MAGILIVSLGVWVRKGRDLGQGSLSLRGPRTPLIKEMQRNDFVVEGVEDDPSRQRCVVTLGHAFSSPIAVSSRYPSPATHTGDLRHDGTTGERCARLTHRINFRRAKRVPSSVPGGCLDGRRQTRPIYSSSFQRVNHQGLV